MAKTEELKPKVTEYDLQRVVQAGVSLQDFTEIVAKAVELAKQGDAASRLFLAAYTIGLPKETVLKLSTLELSERMDASSNDLLLDLYPPKTGRK